MLQTFKERRKSKHHMLGKGARDYHRHYLTSFSYQSFLSLSFSLQYGRQSLYHYIPSKKNGQQEEQTNKNIK